MEQLFTPEEFQKTKFKVKKKKVNIPTPLIEFYYDGEDYYYLTEKSREYSESEGIVTIIQNLNINGIDFEILKECSNIILTKNLKMK